MVQSADVNAALSEHPEDFSVNSFSEHLKELLHQQGVSPVELEKRALLSHTFTYQLLRGERIPCRDIVLRIAVAIHLNIDQTQRLLRLAQRGALYPRVTRDAVLLFALQNRMDLIDTDELLLSARQASLV